MKNNNKPMTFEEMAQMHKENEKKWNALSEEDKEEKRQSLEGWALRIESENEVLEAWVKRGKAQDDGVSG